MSQSFIWAQEYLRRFLPNRVKAFAWSLSRYIQEAVKNLERQLDKKGAKLKRGINSPLSNDYRPECDLSPECNEENAHLYM